MIRDIGAKYNIKGYDYLPLEREKVVEFLSRLGDVKRRQINETENLQVKTTIMRRYKALLI